MMQFDTVPKFGRESFDAATASFHAFAKGAQAAAIEAADFARRSLEQGGATAEKLLGVRTFDKVVEIQGDYVRAAYEALVQQTTRMGELTTDTAKEAFAPIENLVAKSARPV